MPRTKKRIATGDCETNPFKFGDDLAPFVWGHYDGETYQYFWNDDQKICTADYVEYLRDESDLTIYFHNGGKFDLHFLLEYLDPDIMIINGRIAKATMFDGQIEFRDSWLILPIALAQYDKDQIDYQKFVPGERNKHKNEIIRYLRKDCTSLYELCDEFIKRFGNNLTLASTAFKELKKTGYTVQNTYENFDKQMRPFYFGGRVQCFDVGNFIGHYEYFDINSAYPWAMKFRHWHGPQMMCQLKMPETENGSFYAKIDAVSKGALPYRFENKLYFPDDDKIRTYFASGWEIQTGLETGTLDIKKVHLVNKPLLTADFCEYVDKFFAEKASAKLNGDFIAELFAKLMLNSAYGKFGQDGRSFEKFCIVEQGEWPENNPSWEHDMRWRYYADTDTGHTLFVRSDPQYKFYNVATAASVTAKVRAFMWESLLSSDTPLYCDTDSIICKKFNGKIGAELGAWKLEADLTEAHIAQRKMYALRVNPVTEYGPIDQVKTASKGVRLQYNEIKDAIKYAKNIEFKKDAPAMSLKYGPRYFAREINFENIQKNIVRNPN